MASARVIFLVLGMAVLVFFPAAGNSGITSDDAAQAIQESVRQLDLQTVLPKSNVNDPPPPKFRIPGEIVKLIFWGAILAFIAVLIWSLRDVLWKGSRSRKLTQPSEDIAPAETAARMEKARLEADELARQGNFVEAIHILLLQSLSEIRRRLDVSIAVSLTSREILETIGLPLPARHAFAHIIDRVEVSYFGVHVPSAEEYSACRNSYETLSEALREGRS